MLDPQNLSPSLLVQTTCGPNVHCSATLVWMSTDLSQVDVHPVIAGDKVAVAGLPILQLYQHRVVLRSAQHWEIERGNMPIS